MQKDTKNKQQRSKEMTGPYGMCPFVLDPIDACHCYLIDSNEKIESTIHYCQYNFKKCEIYQKNIGEEDVSKDYES